MAQPSPLYSLTLAAKIAGRDERVQEAADGRKSD